MKFTSLSALLLILTLSSFLGCSTPLNNYYSQNKPKISTIPKNLNLKGQPKFPNAALYEISTRPWLHQLSLKYRRAVYLSSIPDDEFYALKQMGVQIVWMMGVWQVGTYGPYARDTDSEKRNFYAKDLPTYQFEDIIGSPYAVYKYTTNPDLAMYKTDPNQDLLLLKAQLNRIGLSLMLDFVVNHMACDCPEAASNPDLFVRAPQSMSKPYDPALYLPNGIANGGPGWIDTIQINFWSESAIRYQIENLKTICKYADAVRVDVAFYALTDFFASNWKKNVESWGYTRPQQEFWTRAFNELTNLGIKQKVMFMAEVYGTDLEVQLQNLGFDYTYHKIVMDNLIASVSDGKMSLNDMQSWIRNLAYQRDFLNHTAHFIENHDEIRAIASFKGDVQKSKVAALFAMTLPGLKFFNLGQFEGKKNRLIVQLRRSEKEDDDYAVFDFYAKKLLPIIGTLPAFQQGTWELMTVKKIDMGEPNGLFTWKWKMGSDKYLVVINLSSVYTVGWVVLPDAMGPAPGVDQTTVIDILNGKSYQRSVETMKTDGLVVGIEPYWAQIFKY